MNNIPRINQDLDLGLLMLIIKKSFVWIAFVFVLTIVIAFLYLRWTPLEYEASSVIQLTQKNQSSSIFEMSSEFYKENLNSEIELIKSPVFLQRVIDRLPLEISYYTKGRILNYELFTSTPFEIKELKVINSGIYDKLIELEIKHNGKIDLVYEIGKKKYTTSLQNNLAKTEHFEFELSIINDLEFLSNSKEYLIKLNNPQKLYSFYSNNLLVEILNPNANSIKMTFRDNNNKKTAEFVNAIAMEYEYFYLQKKQESANKVISYIDENLELVSDMLYQTDTGITNYKRRHGLNNFIDFESIKNIQQLVNEFDNQLLMIELELDVLNQIEKSLRENKTINPFELQSIIYGTEIEKKLEPLVNGIKKIIEDKEESYFSVVEDSKITQRIDYIIELKRKQLLLTISLIKENIAKRKVLLNEKVSLLNSNLKIETDTTNGKRFTELSILQRTKSINEKYYDNLIQKRAELAIAREGYLPDYNILALAQVPSVPIKPDKTNIAIYCLSAWLIISLSLIIIKYLLHDEIINASDVAKYTDCGLLGIVHKYNEEIPVSQLIIDKRPKSRIAESFRSIRGNLQFISNTEGPKIISVTSTIPGEGKTFITINLAGIIAFAGKKVIIIDTDLRKPRIHLGFNTTNEVGMSTLLIGSQKLEDCIKHSSLENLDYITAGPIPPNPSELILSDKMTELLEELKSRYDYVVIDNPPSGLVSDSIINMVRADYPIYVIRSNYSRKFFINNLNQIAKENKLKNLTYVLNGFDVKKGGGYGYGYNYGYGGYNSYGYGYGGYGSYGNYGGGYGYTGGSYGYYEDDEKKSGIPLMFKILKALKLKK